MIRPIVTPRQRGFTLIEVLVALVITAVGLLGLAKMQLLAISGAKESGSRGLIALQTGSLAAAMYANGAYWASGTAPGFTTVGATVTATGAGMPAADSGACKTAKCAADVLAATDVQTWATAMYQQFPTFTSKVICPATLPANCTIYVSWIEQQKAIGNVEGVSRTKVVAAGATPVAQTFSLYVQP